MEISDSELVDRVRAGDRKAFRYVYDRNRERVYRVALGMLRNPEDAMDAVQEVFCRVHNRMADFKGESALSTWLVRVTVNHCIDKKRRQKSWDNRFVADPDVEGVSDASPERLLSEAQMGAAVQDALAELGDDHRTAIQLREIGGLSYDEIAAVMGCPKGTVMSRLHHARKKLQLLLIPFLEEAGPKSLLDRAGDGVRRRV
ncbi:MAG: sigma-70 family RNA polymerase sigma factor [Myxococcales bacterium]|nr:sigma-70 family RNA polymerase sigma factor [Myxococcales bacterium]